MERSARTRKLFIISFFYTFFKFRWKLLNFQRNQQMMKLQKTSQKQEIDFSGTEMMLFFFVMPKPRKNRWKNWPSFHSHPDAGRKKAQKTASPISFVKVFFSYRPCRMHSTTLASKNQFCMENLRRFHCTGVASLKGY